MFLTKTDICKSITEVGQTVARENDGQVVGEATEEEQMGDEEEEEEEEQGDEEEEEEEELPSCPSGLFQFPFGSSKVKDVDEEVLEIYMNLSLSSSTDTDTISPSYPPQAGQPPQTPQAFQAFQASQLTQAPQASQAGQVPQITQASQFTKWPKTRNHPDSNLGYLDSTNSILSLNFLISSDTFPSNSSIPSSSSSRVKGGSSGSYGNTKSRVGLDTSKEKSVGKDIEFEVRLQQDLTALKSRKGDTGSVLWRSSFYLSKYLLNQLLHSPSSPFIDPVILSQCSVLELGSGTGLLSILFSPFCHYYTTSDQYDNIRLIQRNLELNSHIPHLLQRRSSRPPEEISHRTTDNISQRGRLKTKGNRNISKGKKSLEYKDEEINRGKGNGEGNVKVEEIDWFQISKEYQKGKRSGDEERYDLILLVDCIYNENLIKPLIDTLRYCTKKGKTIVWVIVELRSSEVVSISK
ncbi:hypothetical protein M231_05890 [Tremella mesenterica]|uniref:Uncharacterized protein n=1 Tax=Tremella mesenterica TaxID=5217 RepID=A0A4Q1BGU3_TREME|nr:hypothetical protein M231_05890 [Tremella mesenterica]